MTEHAYMDTTSDAPIESLHFGSQVVPVDESRHLVFSKHGLGGLVMAIEVGEGIEKVRLVWPMLPEDVQRLRDFIR